MRLTARQTAFVDAYLISGDATDAAIRAGYSASTAQPWHLLRSAEVKAAIAEGVRAGRQVTAPPMRRPPLREKAPDGFPVRFRPAPGTHTAAYEARPPHGRRSVADHLDFYLAELAAANRSPLTLRNYRNDIEDWLCWCGQSGRDALATTRPQFREYLGELRRRDIASASISRKVSSIHCFYRYLLREEATKRDQLYGIALPKL